MALKVLKAHKVGRAVRVLRAIKGIKGHRVRKEIRVHRVLKETKAIKAIKGIRASREIKELSDFKAQAGRRAFSSTGSTAAEATCQLRPAPGTQSLLSIRIPIRLREWRATSWLTDGWLDSG